MVPYLRGWEISAGNRITQCVDFRAGSQAQLDSGGSRFPGVRLSRSSQGRRRQEIDMASKRCDENSAVLRLNRKCGVRFGFRSVNSGVQRANFN